MEYKSLRDVEVFDYQVISDKEKKPLPKGVLSTLKGPATFSDRENRNKRRYPSKGGKTFWERVLDTDERLREKIDTKTFFGDARHPGQDDSPVPELDDISHAIRDYAIDGDGTVNVTIDVLDTTKGRNIQTLVDYGSKLGISTRAFGEENAQKDGVFEPNEDKYHFVTWDLVGFPAFSEARMEAITDSAEFSVEEIQKMKYGFSEKELLEKVVDMPEKDARSLCDFVGIEYKKPEGKDLQASFDEAMDKIVELEAQVEKLKSSEDHRPLKDFLDKLEEKKNKNDLSHISMEDVDQSLEDIRAEYTLELTELTESYDELKEDLRKSYEINEENKKRLQKKIQGYKTMIDSLNQMVDELKNLKIVSDEALEDIQTRFDELEDVYNQLLEDYENSINNISVLEDQLKVTEELKSKEKVDKTIEDSASTDKPKRKEQPILAPLSDSVEEQTSSDPEMETLKSTISLVTKN